MARVRGVITRFKISQRRQGEAVLDVRRYGHDADPGRNGEGRVRAVKGLGYNHLIARIQAAEYGKENGLAAGRGHHNILKTSRNAGALVVGFQLAAVAVGARAGGVAQHRDVGIAHGVQHFGRRQHIGLANVEGINGFTQLAGGVSIRQQLAKR